jgi:hypothetical protein
MRDAGDSKSAFNRQKGRAVPRRPGEPIGPDRPPISRTYGALPSQGYKTASFPVLVVEESVRSLVWRARCLQIPFPRRGFFHSVTSFVSFA